MTDVLWGAWDGRGVEHLRVGIEAGGVRADSLIVSVDEGRPFRARYTLECDAGWRLQRARIEVTEEPARVMELQVEGGLWTDVRTSAALPLDGCVDIDIYPSPFTNTLPIRRFADATIGQPVHVPVAWVQLPALTIRTVRQEYTLLGRSEAGARWRFRTLDTDFTTELQVDAQGVVLDYPDIARRIL